MTSNQITSQINHLPQKSMSPDQLAFTRRYMGTHKKYLGVKTGDLVKIAKEIVRQNLPVDALVADIARLLFGKTIEEHVVGGKILTFLKPEVRSEIPLKTLEKWLTPAQGWVEVDVICQSPFTGKEVLSRWPEWQREIRRFSKNKSISIRRASLVLMTKPVRETPDPKLRALAFETIEKLKPEKDILITKAVSWLLRSLIFQNKAEVKKYLLANEATLPRIAYRETMRKIETGKK